MILSAFSQFARSIQVKYHGQYPPRRLHEFAAYQREKSNCRAVGVLLLSMVPCLLITIALDAIPLNSPAMGAKDNQLFFVRITTGFWITACLEFIQLRHYVKALQLSNAKLILLSTAVAIVTLAGLKGFVGVIGFPLPFTMLLGFIPWVPSMLVALVLVGLRSIVTNERHLRHLRNAIRVCIGQFVLVAAWPLYFIALRSTPTMVRTVIMLLVLPLIKLSLRHGFSRALPHLLDEGPEVVTFNTDVLSSLSLLSSTNSTSVLFTIGLWVVDGVWAIVHTQEIRRMNRDMSSYEAVMLGKEAYSRRVLAWEDSRNAMELRFGLVDRTEMRLRKLWRQLPAAKRFSVVPIAKLESKRRLVRFVSKGAAGGNIEALFEPAISIVSTKSFNPTTKKHWPRGMRPVVPIQINSRRGTRSHVKVKSRTQEQLSAEERDYTERARQVLYTMEYIVLLSYIEAAVPMIYGCYLMAIFWMPNRAYYSQTADMDESALGRALLNVVLYFTMQVATLAAICVTYHRTLRVSGLKQISFVLERQTLGVQTKLTFWLLYFAHTSLAHCGYDYSLQFSWLHDPPPP